MEPISMILSTAVGYILKAAAHSKTADTAKEEVLGRFWKWIRPHFMKDAPAIEEKPDDPNTGSKVSEHLLALIRDENFFKELTLHISALQKAGIKEKNIVRGDITNVKRIKIGDKEYSPNDVYDQKNVIEGNVKDADEFILGDGN